MGDFPDESLVVAGYQIKPAIPLEITHSNEQLAKTNGRYLKGSVTVTQSYQAVHGKV